MTEANRQNITQLKLFAGIIQVLVALCGQVYSLLGICVPAGVFTASVCLQLALCAVMKTYTNQLVNSFQGWGRDACP